MIKCGWSIVLRWDHFDQPFITLLRYWQANSARTPSKYMRCVCIAHERNDTNDESTNWPPNFNFNAPAYILSISPDFLAFLHSLSRQGSKKLSIPGILLCRWPVKDQELGQRSEINTQIFIGLVYICRFNCRVKFNFCVFLGFVMGWRYRAGLFLIAAVVIIWVTSAEVTQVTILLPLIAFSSLGFWSKFLFVCISKFVYS